MHGLRWTENIHLKDGSRSHLCLSLLQSCEGHTGGCHGGPNCLQYQLQMQILVGQAGRCGMKVPKYMMVSLSPD